jgi:hypothetical protein
VQKIRQKMTVGDIGRRRRGRMDDLCLAVDADMRLHAKIPLVPLPRLMHLGVGGVVRVALSRRSGLAAALAVR